MSGRFAGRAVLVTGGTSGIGAATALLFAEEGADVLMTGRNAANAAEVIAEARGFAGRFEHLENDLMAPESPERIVAETVARFGRIDVVFNNAGLHHRFGTLETEPRHWMETMTLNVNAVFFTAQAAARRMVAGGGGGAIVNMASDLGLFTEQQKVSYCTSKAAVVAMTRAMALDLAPHGIRVNAIAPGDTWTPMIRNKIKRLGMDEAAGMAHLSAPVAMKRMASVREIAEGVAFLASDEASYVTGTTLSVDGGTAASARAWHYDRANEALDA